MARKLLVTLVPGFLIVVLGVAFPTAVQADDPPPGDPDPDLLCTANAPDVDYTYHSPCSWEDWGEFSAISSLLDINGYKETDQIADGTTLCGYGCCATINCPPPILTTMEVSVSAAELYTGEQATITVSGKDQYGNMVEDFSPECSAASGRIDKNTFTAGEETGETTITCTDPATGTSAAVNVNVIAKKELAEIVLTPTEAQVPAGGEQQFEAYGLDFSGDIFPIDPVWQAEAGAITNDGLYTAEGFDEGFEQGVIDITVIDQNTGMSAKAKVEVSYHLEEVSLEDRLDNCWAAIFGSILLAAGVFARQKKSIYSESWPF